MDGEIGLDGRGVSKPVPSFSSVSGGGAYITEAASDTCAGSESLLELLSRPHPPGMFRGPRSLIALKYILSASSWLKILDSERSSSPDLDCESEEPSEPMLPAGLETFCGGFLGGISS
jgi:hypothetical protein